MNTLQAFPLAHLVLLVLTVLIIWETAWWWSHRSIHQLDIALALMFFLSLYWPLLSLHHTKWKSQAMRISNYCLQGLAFVLWALYFYFLQGVVLSNMLYWTALLYFWVFPLAIAWIFLLIWWLSRKSSDGIRLSWINIIKAVCFWILAWLIVYWGLSWALASIEALFDINLSYHWYRYFWAFSMVFLSGSFILNYYLIEKESVALIWKSRVRTIFWSYIILPLALIYLAIFLAYWIKILITWNWPKWIIVWLWYWYFSLWILSYLLTYPEKTKLYEILHKILFISFLFIVVLMICAISQRIAQYGITINRYFICALIAAIWIFSLLALCFKNHRLLSFVSIFFLFTAISLYWPFSAKNLSLGLQYKRLSSLLAVENIHLPLKENSLVWLTWDNARIIVWLIDEIIETNEKKDWDWNILALNLNDWISKWSLRSKAHELLGLDGDYDYAVNYSSTYFHVWSWDDSASLDINWYSKLSTFRIYNFPNNSFEYDGAKYDLTPYYNNVYEMSLMDDADQIPIIFEVIDWNKKFIITSVSWERTFDNKISFTYLWWYLLEK